MTVMIAASADPAAVPVNQAWAIRMHQLVAANAAGRPDVHLGVGSLDVEIPEFGGGGWEATSGSRAATITTHPRGHEMSFRGPQEGGPVAYRNRTPLPG